MVCLPSPGRSGVFVASFFRVCDVKHGRPRKHMFLGDSLEVLIGWVDDDDWFDCLLKSMGIPFESVPTSDRKDPRFDGLRGIVFPSLIQIKLVLNFRQMTEKHRRDM